MKHTDTEKLIDQFRENLKYRTKDEIDMSYDSCAKWAPDHVEHFNRLRKNAQARRTRRLQREKKEKTP